MRIDNQFAFILTHQAYSMDPLPPTTQTLSSLLRLLDDDSPQVRQSVVEALRVFDGDVSEWLHEMNVTLSADEYQTLQRLLYPARRERLQHEWVVPAGGMAALNDDWESVEALTRSLSDFAHDGITLRPPLPDALDMLADELAPAYESGGERELCLQYLKKVRLERSDSARHDDLTQYDLAKVIWQGSTKHEACLLIIAIFVGQRLGADLRYRSLRRHGFIEFDQPNGEKLAFIPGQRQPIMDYQEWIRWLIRHMYCVEDTISAPDRHSPSSLLLVFLIELQACGTGCELDEDGELFDRLLDSLLMVGNRNVSDPLP